MFELERFSFLECIERGDKPYQAAIVHCDDQNERGQVVLFEGKRKLLYNWSGPFDFL